MKTEERHISDLTLNCDTARRPVKSADRKAGSIPYYGASGVVDLVDGWTHEGDYLLVAEDGENLRTRSTPIAWMTKGRVWVNNHVHVLQPRNRLDGQYLAHLLAITDISGYLTGSTLPKLTQTALSSIRLRVPAENERKGIAEVLGALDDKIAANRALVDACQSLSVALASAAPEKTTLAEVAHLSRKMVSPNGGSVALISHYSLPAFDSGTLPSFEEESSIKSAKFLLESACVLVSKLNPRIPRLWAVDEPTGPPAWASTEFMPLIPREVSHRLLWSVLAQPEFGQALAERVAGTSGSHQRVTPNDILEATIRDPRTIPLGVRDQIESLVELAGRQRRESRTLAELRDTLLPQLMSGKLRIRDAERAVEDVL